MIDKVLIEKLFNDAKIDTQFLVDIKISKDDCISVILDDYNGLSIDECCRIHKFIASSLDSTDEDYSLEVSSPGLTSSFKTIEQYHKHIGKIIDIVLKSGNKISGKLLSVNTDFIKIENLKPDTDNTPETIAFIDIKTVKININIT